MSDSTLVQEITDAIVKNVNRGVLRTIAENPTATILNLEDLSDENIRKYFFSLGTTTWCMWSIFDPVSLEKATEFFKSEVHKFYSFLLAIQDTVGSSSSSV